MTRYIIRRLLQAVVMVWVVATIVALAIHAVPGDPAYVILGEDQVTEARVQAVREELGLNRPIHVQYFEWLGNVVRGDPGRSLINNRPIREDLPVRLGRTLELGVTSLLISVIVGIPLGVIAANYRNRLPDVAVTTISVLGLSIPVFVIGPLLILTFSLYLGVLPTSGYIPISEDPWEHLRRLALPAVTLGVLSAATIIRMTRSSVLEVLGEDYVRTARAKGVHERRVLMMHALRNAMIPVVAITGLQLGTLLGSSVLVEYIFNWPGLSMYLVTAINQRDYPIVQAVVLVIAIFFILINLLTDLTYALLDPRIRYE